MALNKSIWDPKPRVSNIAGTNVQTQSLCLVWASEHTAARIGSASGVSEPEYSRDARNFGVPDLDYSPLY